MLSSVFFVCLSVLFFSLKVQGFQGSTHAFLASAGGKKGPTLRFLPVLASPQYTRCSDKDIFYRQIASGKRPQGRPS